MMKFKFINSFFLIFSIFTYFNLYSALLENKTEDYIVFAMIESGEFDEILMHAEPGQAVALIVLPSKYKRDAISIVLLKKDEAILSEKDIKIPANARLRRLFKLPANQFIVEHITVEKKVTDKGNKIIVERSLLPEVHTPSSASEEKKEEKKS